MEKEITLQHFNLASHWEAIQCLFQLLPLGRRLLLHEVLGWCCALVAHCNLEWNPVTVECLTFSFFFLKLKSGEIRFWNCKQILEVASDLLHYMKHHSLLLSFLGKNITV